MDSQFHFSVDRGELPRSDANIMSLKKFNAGSAEPGGSLGQSITVLDADAKYLIPNLSAAICRMHASDC